MFSLQKPEISCTLLSTYPVNALGEDTEQSTKLISIKKNQPSEVAPDEVVQIRLGWGCRGSGALFWTNNHNFERTDHSQGPPRWRHRWAQIPLSIFVLYGPKMLLTFFLSFGLFFLSFVLF